MCPDLLAALDTSEWWRHPFGLPEAQGLGDLNTSAIQKTGCCLRHR
jgi:hypothetical protein